MKRALLVIDVQNEYFDGKLPVTYPEGSFANILNVMDAAVTHNIPVIVVRHGSKDADALYFKTQSYEWELHPEIEQKNHQLLIDKEWPDSFAGTGLDEWLKKNMIDTVTICGYMTHMCCDTTARRAFHLGYNVEFLSDATGTLTLSTASGSVQDKELHNTVLVIQERFSTIMTSRKWQESL